MIHLKVKLPAKVKKNEIRKYFSIKIIQKYTNADIYLTFRNIRHINPLHFITSNLFLVQFQAYVPNYARHSYTFSTHRPENSRHRLL